MKKLTASILTVVFASSCVVAQAQEVKSDSTQSKQIEEVVITALGIKREKKSLGYASQEIKASALTEGTTKTGNVASLLSGKVAGLNVTTTNNFGGSSNIVIRGIKSLGGSNPLIVIDGSPVNNSSTYGGSIDYGNALSDINQEDIESVNVLKGAAASALYGERGMNGVVVITTKNGKGKEDNSWGVTLSSGINVGFIDRSTFPKFQTKYGAGYEQSFYQEDADANGIDYVNMAEDGSWGPAFDSNKLVWQWDAFDPTSPNYGKATPWVAAKNDPSKFFEKAITYVNSVTLEKGQKGKNISFTYDNLNSNGIMPNSSLNKNNFSLKVNYDLTPRLHTSFYSTLTLQNTKGRNITGYSDNIMSNFRQWWQTNVDVLALRDAYFRNIADPSQANNYGNITWNRKSSTNAEPAYWNNPYFQLYQNYSTDKRTRVFSYGSATYDITDNISATAKVSLDRSNLTIDNRLAIGSLAMSFGNSGKDVGSGYARQDITRQEVNYDLMLNYKFNITDNINVSGVLGGNVRRNDYNSIYASTEGGLVARNIYSLENTKQSVLAPLETQWTTQTESGYATASFDFYKKFYLDATYRVDKTSTLPAGKNVYGYPSITGAVILSEFFKPSWLRFWKLRANYAEVGGTADPYQLKSYYSTAGIYSGTTVYRPITNIPNSDLKPQRSKEFEVGTEVSLFRDRLSFDFAYYHTKTLNQIITLPISGATGQLGKVINAGRIDNKGIEAQLSVTPVKTSDFKWTVDFNWAKNINKVEELYGDVTNYQLETYQGGVTLNAPVGEAWGTLIGTDYKYDDNGNKVLETYVSGGKTYARYKKESNKVIGNAMPDWTGGIRNTFSYKGFSLNFLIDIRKGGDVFSTDMFYGLATGVYAETAEGDIREKGLVLPGVLENGTANTYIARNPNDYGAAGGYVIEPNKAFVYDGSYVKLREASVSYAFPKSWLTNTFITDAKVAIVGRNLWIIHKNLPHADPEAMVGGGNRAYGWSTGSTPTVREVGVSVTVKF